MRQKLKEHSRRRWHSCLIIRAIPHTSTTPLRFICSAEVIHYLAHYQVCKVTRSIATCSTLKLTLIKLGIEYSQRTYCRIIVCNTRIRVERKREVDRNTKSISLLKSIRATHQSINPLATTHIVILIVVTITLRSIDRLIKARPLQPIARTLTIARHTACNRSVIHTLNTHRIDHRTSYITITAAYLYSICTNNTTT